MKAEWLPNHHHQHPGVLLCEHTDFKVYTSRDLHSVLYDGYRFSLLPEPPSGRFHGGIKWKYVFFILHLHTGVWWYRSSCYVLRVKYFIFSNIRFLCTSSKRPTNPFSAALSLFIRNIFDTQLELFFMISFPFSYIF